MQFQTVLHEFNDLPSLSSLPSSLPSLSFLRSDMNTLYLPVPGVGTPCPECLASSPREDRSPRRRWWQRCWWWWSDWVPWGWRPGPCPARPPSCPGCTWRQQSGQWAGRWWSWKVHKPYSPWWEENVDVMFTRIVKADSKQVVEVKGSMSMWEFTPYTPILMNDSSRLRSSTTHLIFASIHFKLTSWMFVLNCSQIITH